MTIPRAMKQLVIGFIPILLMGCGALMPRSEKVTHGPWQNFQEAQDTFDRIIPYKTTTQNLKTLKLDPVSNPNITLMNYSDVLRRFVPSPSVNASDLDPGVQDCVISKTACKGYELDQKTLKRNRYGNFWVDFLNFNRKVDITGWRFNGVILIKNDVVVYKLTGGQPFIHEYEENENPLGPFQGIGESKLLSR